MLVLVLSSCAVHPSTAVRDAEASTPLSAISSAGVSSASSAVGSGGDGSRSALVVSSGGSGHSAAISGAVAAVGGAGVDASKSGLDALRACLGLNAELSLSPKAAYESKSVQGLASRLGFRTRPGESPLAAFCEPEFREKQCAYADCSLAGAAFFWKQMPHEGLDLTGFLLLTGPKGMARAYRVDRLELSDPEFACGCMAAGEFSRVSALAPDVIVVDYHSQTRPGRMCSDAYSHSIWLLDARRAPMALIRESFRESPLVEATRTSDAIQVRVSQQCEVTVDWSELQRITAGV